MKAKILSDFQICISVPLRKSAAILNDFNYSICSSLDFEYRLRVIIFTQERAPRQTFTYLRSTIETLKKSVKIIQS